MGELLETAPLRGQIARFLHKHKDHEDRESAAIRTEPTHGDGEPMHGEYRAV